MKVKVYSTSWCAYCHALMDWLDSLGVKYEEIDAEPLFDTPDFPYTGVPVTKIGKDVIIGFDRPAIQKSLKDNGVL